MNDKQVGDEAWARAVLHARRTWLQRPFRLSLTGMSDWKLVDRNSCLPDRDSSFSAVGKIQGFQYVWKIALSKWHVAHFRDCSRFLPDPAPVVWWAMLELGPTCSVSQVACQVAQVRLPGRSHHRSAGQWTMFVPRTKTVTIGPRGFYCCALVSGTPCLDLFVTLICHLRISGGHWNFICLSRNFMYLGKPCKLLIFLFTLLYCTTRAFMIFNPYTPKGVAATPL